MSWVTPRKQVRVNNVRFSLGVVNWITHFRWYLFKVKEPEVRYFFDKFLREKDVIFDVGANIGVFSLYVARCRDDVHVYAIEPEISNIFMLRENIIANNVKERVHPVCAAVSDQMDLAKLYLASEELGAAVHSVSSRPIEVTDLGYKVVGTEIVSSITLDQLSASVNRVPNLVKIDTDGHEIQILRGAEKLLNNQILRAIIIEIPYDKQDASECREILRRAGFVMEDYLFPKTLNQIWVRQGVSP